MAEITTLSIIFYENKKYLLIADYYHRLKVFNENDLQEIVNIWSPGNKGIFRKILQVSSENVIVLLETE